MRARTTPLPMQRRARELSESSSCFSSSFDLEGVLGTPLEANPSAPGFERVLRGRLEVLPYHSELAPRVELDDVSGEHAHVDDVADAAELAAAGFVEVHPDLLRSDRELSAVPLEHVRDTDEAGDELGCGTLVDLGRRTDLLDPALVEHCEAVAHRERLLLVVGDVDEGDADVADLALDALQLDLHLLPELQVERPQRLVEQQHAWGIHERARERDALT